MASGDTKTESYLRAAAEGTRADLPSDTCCNTKTQNLILGVANRIMDVEDEVEELKNNPDVVDIVDTYADLQAYDTSILTDKDIIRVLEDSTHNNKSTYYRWNASTNQFDYIGEAGGGVNVVQTTGNSTTDVMSQNATTKMVYKDPTTKRKIVVGDGATVPTSSSDYCIIIGQNSEARRNWCISLGVNASTRKDGDIAIGYAAKTSPTNNYGNVISIGAGAGDANSSNTDYSISIGNNCATRSQNSIAIGHSAYAQNTAVNSVAIGYGANTTVKGQFDIGTSGANGYNDSAYRLLTGVHDPQNAHDAATKGYVDTKLGGMTLVSISQTDYDNLSTKDPNTLYIITGA